jgi:hypothetical protein
LNSGGQLFVDTHAAVRAVCGRLVLTPGEHQAGVSPPVPETPRARARAQGSRSARADDVRLGSLSAGSSPVGVIVPNRCPPFSSCVQVPAYRPSSSNTRAEKVRRPGMLTFSSTMTGVSLAHFTWTGTGTATSTSLNLILAVIAHRSPLPSFVAPGAARQE